MVFRIDHVGYAVRDMDLSRKQFEALGFVGHREVIEDETRNVRLLFMQLGDYTIELVAPLREGSPVDGYLKSVGPGTYHLCYAVDDIERQCAKLQQENYKVIVPPQPAVAMDNRKVAFLMHRDLGLIELLEHHLGQC